MIMTHDPWGLQVPTPTRSDPAGRNEPTVVLLPIRPSLLDSSLMNSPRCIAQVSCTFSAIIGSETFFINTVESFGVALSGTTQGTATGELPSAAKPYGHRNWNGDRSYLHNDGVDPADWDPCQIRIPSDDQLAKAIGASRAGSR